MEKKIKKKDDVYIKLRRELDSRIKQFPQETSSNSMTTTQKTFSFFWRPNNYRRQVKVKLKDNSTIKRIKSAISAISKHTFSYEPHTKMVSIKNYAQNKNNKGITIQYGRDTLTGIYSQNIIGGEKEIFLIEAYSIKDIEERIAHKKKEIKAYIDRSLKQFIKEFNLGIPFSKIGWSRYEDFIKGEDYIDKIPREVIIHDTFFKKVYGEGIEFKKTDIGEEPTVHMKNYIKNRAIENVAPEISKELQETKEMVMGVLKVNASTSQTLNRFITSFLPTQQEFGLNIKQHNKVIKEMSKGFKKFNSLLSQKKLKEFM